MNFKKMSGPTLIVATVTFLVLFQFKPVNDNRDYDFYYTAPGLATSYFLVGYKEYENKSPVGEACSFKNHRKVFCLEGYYYAKALLSDLKNIETSAMEPIADLGVGMAYAQKGLEPALRPFNIDGWAFQKTLVDKYFRDGLPESCNEKFSTQDRVKYCLWGAGRALFFHQPKKLDEYLKYPDIRARGARFASLFTADPDKNLKKINVSHPAVKDLVNTFQSSFFRQLSKDEVNWFMECMNTHSTHCLKL